MRKILLLVLFVLVESVALSVAQGIPLAWTSQLAKGSTKLTLLTQRAFSCPVLPKIPLSYPLQRINTGRSVVTSSENWIKYNFVYKNPVLNSQEKIVLATPNKNVVETLGKLSLLYDRSAIFHEQLLNDPQYKRESAYDIHQETLKNTLSEIEGHELALSKIANEEDPFITQLRVNSLLDKKKIIELIETNQPLFFCLTSQEINEFPSLTTKDEQLAYLKKKGFNANQSLMQLVGKNLEEISTREYVNYYLLKLRLIYFRQAYAKVITEGPLSSLIIRNNQLLPLPFLPRSTELLSDAQRLGKLYYYLDKLEGTQLDLFEKTKEVKEIESLKNLILKQENLYQNYAIAEAFGISYEEELYIYGPTLPVILFGKEQGEIYLKWSDAQKRDFLLEKLNQVKAQKNKLSHETETLSLYTEYYKLQRLQSYCQLMLRFQQSK